MAQDNKTGKFALGAAIAGVAGYVAGILTAPKSGKETRQDIAKKAGEVKEDAEEQLQKAQTELKDLAAKVQVKSSELSGKAKAEYQAAVVKAKDAQNKTGEVLRAVRKGKAKNPDLDAAIKQVREAKKNLGKYLRA